MYFELTLVSFGLLTGEVAALAQPMHPQSWLDRPLVDWNRQEARPPQLPRPPNPQVESELASRCREQVRQPSSLEEKAIVQGGWMLYGPARSNATTTVLTGMSSVDGMCRPMAYRAFVFSDGKFAGTLSPVSMDSRADSSLTNIRLDSPTRITADFARYGESDPLCCPSNISTVSYEITGNENPVVIAVKVTVRPTSQPDRQTQLPLFGKRWTLTETGKQPSGANSPYIEFDEKQHRASGDTGCNRFFGELAVEGTSVRISHLGSTKRACLSEDANRREAQFLRSLEKTTRFEVHEGTLRLYAGDLPILVFIAK
jgi:heat shock protein HslJ